jgi:lysophospholipase
MFTRFDYFQSSDGLRIRWGCLPAPPSSSRGTVVLLNGRTEYLEKYAETAADLNQRGFAVYSMDWRGQGLSDRLTPNRLKGHVGRFRDYLDDLGHLVRMAQHHGPPPYLLMGHSMGGHIGIRYLREYGHPFTRAVLTSPMIDIELPAVPRKLLPIYVKLAGRLGFGQAFTPGGAAYEHKDRIFDDNPLTSDPVRFQRRLAELDAHPQLALGGVTYGWLQAAFDSIERVTAPGYARGLTLPLLIVRATEERIVSLAAQQCFCRQAPDCRLVDIPEARHEVLVETDSKRRLFWEAFDRFLSETDSYPADSLPAALQ